MELSNLIFMLERAGGGSSYEIQFSLTIGRIHADVPFPHDDLMSSTHARFDRKLDQVYLTDLNSSNGTFVNDHRLEPEQPVLLKDCDRITMGSHTLLFRALVRSADFALDTTNEGDSKSSGGWEDSSLDVTKIDVSRGPPKTPKKD